MRKVAIWGQLCEIATSQNIRSPVYTKDKLIAYYLSSIWTLAQAARGPHAWSGPQDQSLSLFLQHDTPMFLDKIFRILDFLTPWTPIPRIWYCNNPSSHPSLVNQSRVEMIQWTSTLVFRRSNIIVVPSAIKSFLFELHMEMSYYLNIFVQHGRIVIHIPLMGCSGFLNFWQKKSKDFSRTFKDIFPFFQGLCSVQNRALNLCLF